MNVDAGQYPITRQLPKTGQIIIYMPPGFRDDGDIQAGWWKGRQNWNNKTRFLTKTIAGAAVVIDRATGLMWPLDWSGTGGNGGGLLNWDAAITWGAALNFAGFTDWRIPNVNELASLVHWEAGAAGPYVWPTFQNVYNNIYWTSTTLRRVTTNAHRIRFQNPIIDNGLKTTAYYVIAVRKGV